MKRAKTVAVSSTEVEYAALSNVSKQAIWTEGFINSLQALDRTDTLPMLGNNTSSIKMTKNKKFRRARLGMKEDVIAEIEG